MTKFEKLIDRARSVRMSPQQLEEQRRSFAFGNAAIENSDITRELIDVQADLIPTNYVR